MMSRPRVAWLLDTNDPSGAAMMAMRRLAALHPYAGGTALCLRRAPVGPPSTSPLRGIVTADSISGRVAFNRAHTVVTTSEKTLRWASRRRRPGIRLVHVAHGDPTGLLAREAFMEDIGSVDLVLLPPGHSLPGFAAAVGLPASSVAHHEDFVAPGESPLATARARVFLFVGRFRDGSGALELAQAFALAAAELEGWQLRFVGWGEQRAQINRVAREHHLGARLTALRPSYDVSGDYLEAGYLVRPAARDAQGLPVLEALAHGVPVLAGAGVPAVDELVLHGQNGHVLPRTDPFEIAQALVELSLPELQAALAAGARSSRSTRQGTDLAQLCGWVGARFTPSDHPQSGR